MLVGLCQRRYGRSCDLPPLRRRRPRLRCLGSVGVALELLAQQQQEQLLQRVRAQPRRVIGLSTLDQRIALERLRDARKRSRVDAEVEERLEEEERLERRVRRRVTHAALGPASPVLEGAVALCEELIRRHGRYVGGPKLMFGVVGGAGRQRGIELPVGVCVAAGVETRTRRRGR